MHNEYPRKNHFEEEGESTPLPFNTMLKHMLTNQLLGLCMAMGMNAFEFGYSRHFHSFVWQDFATLPAHGGKTKKNGLIALKQAQLIPHKLP